MENTTKTPEELRKELSVLEKRRYRLEMKARNLEHNVSSCDPDDFDGLMYELEETREQLVGVGLKCAKIKCKICTLESAQ